MNYDTRLFIEIIESFAGIIFLRELTHENGTKARFYSGLNGNIVEIDVTDEDIDMEDGKEFLEKLGLSAFIENIFPEQRDQFEMSNEDKTIIEEAKRIMETDADLESRKFPPI